ncbi:uncharacterized protein DUF4249 [Chitinophaga niastensis]|uniref:Uncharacterized protein DUF4249 n=1 Tax=Chitinophaga niastensis TaxID=536980 RepID=A0A2P8HDH5_CHINA|nr:DUF4249 domain-containing protein [Chitinophaga niastensis]PSL44279.1 uncharacterized protein DUF4249 [Chitinophaga niastensis]
MYVPFLKYRYKQSTGLSWWLFMIAGMLQCTACKKTYTPSTHLTNKLVILAELTAGDTIKIPVGKSTLIENGSTINFEKITNASVHLQDALGHFWLLPFNASPEYSNGPTSIYSYPQKIIADQTYTIDISQPDLEAVKATTHIPAAFTITEVDTLREMYTDQPVLTFNFTINDVPGEEDFYIIEALKQVVKIYRHFTWQNITYNYDTPDGKALYDRLKDQYPLPLLKDTIPTNTFIRLNMFNRDMLTDNSAINYNGDSFHRIFLSDASFDGEAYRTTVSVNTQYFTSDNTMMQGSVLFMVKSVSRGYYDYLFQYEKNKIDFGTLPSSHSVTPSGNITNGLGILGGVYKNQLTYYFDTF